ncbi:MAG: NeuD/PglB/VioB family sugar acetyltransferase [Proteobacteria bacterium]|nr:NeuD/PglB/VioB family sugar acetyltransferase [Pseudomonadota bacterium]
MLKKCPNPPPSPILLVGDGGHARSCIDVLESAGLRIAGLVGMHHEAASNIFGYKMLGVDEDLPILIKTASSALVAVGQIGAATTRIRLFERLREIGYALPAIVSPRAYVSPHARIGAGSIVMHGAIVNAGASIGTNCIINSQALIEHDSDVGNHCHIATRAVLNGDVRVGQGSFIGSASVVREGVILGQQCVVGMGLSIRHNQPDGSLIVANR